ncbi:MAG TPA: class I SAM-dependent methyltransferase, partial [Vicinamibacterales bacterium]|nr:class I SAM-dependent methyltransferase [Vicinamibacterales bacterium]
IEPYLERQESFNSLLVDHLNRSTPGVRALAAHAADVARGDEEYRAALARFHTRLIEYLQQITLYVDTKDRAVAAHLRCIVDALADELLRGTESVRTRERRLEQIRDTVAALQQRTSMLQREMERLVVSGVTARQSAEAARSPATLDRFRGHTYVGFEDRFRGSQPEVRQRQAMYVDEFRGARDVLDVGCGRGEFLELLQDAGIPARGIDLNGAMVEVCRSRSLAAEEADAVTYLESLPDGSLGGLFAAQVVEHMPAAYLLRFLDAAYLKLRPGSKIVLETINPTCWTAFFDSYIRDLTHVHPVHPDTLRYLLGASGFGPAEIRYASPYPEAQKLQVTTIPEHADAELHRIVDAYNAVVMRLNSLMFSYLDYAAIAVRP